MIYRLGFHRSCPKESSFGCLAVKMDGFMPHSSVTSIYGFLILLLVKEKFLVKLKTTVLTVATTGILFV